MLDPAPQIRLFRFGDGYRAAVRVWQVPSPIARVVFLHGIISHGGWYLSSCAMLARNGFEVHAMDRRGSGLNLAARGDVDRFETWLGDVEQYLEELSGDVPRLLLGISWGGTLAAAVARHRGDLLAGVGFLCPGIYSRKAATLVQRAALRLAGVVGLKNSRVTIPLQDPALFTNHPGAQAYIASDPLTLRKMTIRFALANLDLTRYATEAPGQIHVRPLLMLAQRDPITDNPRVREFVERIDHPQKTLIEYPDASHTLEFEPDTTAYFRDLCQWCQDAAQ